MPKSHFIICRVFPRRQPPAHPPPAVAAATTSHPWWDCLMGTIARSARALLPAGRPLLEPAMPGHHFNSQKQSDLSGQHSPSYCGGVSPHGRFPLSPHPSSGNKHLRKGTVCVQSSCHQPHKLKQYPQATAWYLFEGQRGILFWENIRM